MNKLVEKSKALVLGLYHSKDADRAVEESKTMQELVSKLLPVAFALILSGVLVQKVEAKPWKRDA